MRNHTFIRIDMFSGRMLHWGTRKAGLSVAYNEFMVRISDTFKDTLASAVSVCLFLFL
jgi:hypothetical protein